MAVPRRISALLPCSLALLAGVFLSNAAPRGALAPGATRLDAKISYTGAGEVDARRPVFLLAFDDEPSTGRMIAVERVAKNGATATFRDLPETVHLVAIYDPAGLFTGLSGMIPGSSLWAYAEEGSDRPSPFSVGRRTKLDVTFGDENQLPGDPSTLVPPGLPEAEGVVEIRTYTIREGQRERFVEWFERATLAQQAAAGIRVVGQFRSLENEDVFVWMRAYASHEERVEALRDFYLGPDWLAVQDEAIEMIADTQTLLVEPTKRSDLR